METRSGNALGGPVNVVGGPRRLRILYVDDELPILRLQAKILTQLGYEVVAVPRGQEGLELLEDPSETFDLIISDVQMPGLTGLEFAARVRARLPNLPIILCTASGEVLKNLTPKDLGVSRFLFKPFTKSMLAEALAQVLPAGTPCGELS